MSDLLTRLLAYGIAGAIEGAVREGKSAEELHESQVKRGLYILERELEQADTKRRRAILDELHALAGRYTREGRIRVRVLDADVLDAEVPRGRKT